MSARENFVSIEGNLVAEPELRFTPSGTAVTTITVALSERRLIDDTWTDGATSYFDAVVWQDLAERVCDSFTKGSRVVVQGALKQRSWEDKDSGQKRYKVEIAADSVNASLRFATVAVSKASFGGMDTERIERATSTTRPTGAALVPAGIEEEPY